MPFNMEAVTDAFQWRYLPTQAYATYVPGLQMHLGAILGYFCGLCAPPLTAGREEGDFFHEPLGRQLVLFAQGGPRGHCVGAMAHARRATRHRGDARRGSVTIIDWEHDQGAVVTYTQRDTAWAAVQTAVGRFPHTWVVRLPDDSVRRAGGQGGGGPLRLKETGCTQIFCKR